MTTDKTISDALSHVEPESKFPVGGPRQAVYDALTAAGFTMSNWSDKFWTREDLTAHVYGSGSKLCVRRDKTIIVDAPISAALGRIPR